MPPAKDSNDRRTQPRRGSPTTPRKTRRQRLDEQAAQNPDLLASPVREDYIAKRALDSDGQATKRRQNARRRSKKDLPPICGCPLDKPIKAGSPEDSLTPWEIRMYGIEDTYLSICCRHAGVGTDHLGTGYCDACEIRTARKMTPSHKRDTTHQRKAQRGMTPAQLRRFTGEVMVRRDILGQRLDIGPHEALLEEVQRTAGTVAWLDGLIKELAAKNDPGTEHQILTQMSKMGVEPSAIYQIYMTERKHLIDSSKAAIACGVAERKVKLAEEQGRMLVMVLQAFVYDSELALSPAQLQMAPQIIRKHMLALPSSTNPELYVDQVASQRPVTVPTHTQQPPATAVIDVEHHHDAAPAPPAGQPTPPEQPPAQP